VGNAENVNELLRRCAKEEDFVLALLTGNMIETAEVKLTNAGVEVEHFKATYGGKEQLLGGIVTVTGTLLFVTVAYSLGWLSGAMFCCIIWLLQLHSLSEIGQWQIDVDFCRQNCRESSKFEREEHVTKVNQLECEIVRLRHQRAEDQKSHEFQLQQQLKAEAQRISESRKRIEVLNADRQSLLEKEVDKLTTEIQENRKTKEFTSSSWTKARKLWLR